IRPLRRALLVKAPGDSATKRLSVGLAGPEAVARRRFVGAASGEAISKPGLQGMCASSGMIFPSFFDGCFRGPVPEATGDEGPAPATLWSVAVEPARPPRRLDERAVSAPVPGRLRGVSPTSTPPRVRVMSLPFSTAAAAGRRLRVGVYTDAAAVSGIV
ncbi:unnamed protein product, partial [Ectocarpus sp. 12 AP-2014]